MRSNAASISHGDPPSLKTFAQNKHHVIVSSMKHEENFGDVEVTYLPDAIVDESDKIAGSTGSRLGARTATLTPKQAPGNYGAIKNNSLLKSFRMSMFRGREVTVSADALDMDHHYLSFGQYMWAQLMVGPQALWLWITGSTVLIIRDKLFRRGWIEAKPLDAEALVSKLLLESAVAIHYQGKKTDADGNIIAGFFFADFPIVLQDGTFKVVDLLQVDVDLKKKRMVSAKMDDEELNAKEVAILIFFYTISAFHVKLHSMANWAVNMEKEQIKKNPFVARNSLVTTIYNYFGYSSFSSFFPFWKVMGLLGKDWDPESWISSIVHGISENVFCHPIINEMAPYSEFVDFHCKLRPYFLKEFAKSKQYYFPGYHGEAMYIGTIMHSLDHCRMDWNIEDPLWLDVDHPRFGKMAEIGRIVKVGFVSDLPGLLFHRRYKDSGHPFYDAIYEKAATINVKLADQMDTCIVK